MLGLSGLVSPVHRGARVSPLRAKGTLPFLELEAAKEILAEVFEVTLADVEDMIGQRLGDLASEISDLGRKI